MLRDRATPVDLFALVPALELRFEPELAELDRLLEDDQLFQQIEFSFGSSPLEHILSSRPRSCPPSAPSPSRR